MAWAATAALLAAGGVGSVDVAIASRATLVKDIRPGAEGSRKTSGSAQVSPRRSSSAPTTELMA